MLEMCVLQKTSIWQNFVLIVLRIQKKYAKLELLLCSNVYDDSTDFEICGFQKTQKSRYLENEILIFYQIKNSLITHQGLLYCKNNFVAEVTFKPLRSTCWLNFAYVVFVLRRLYFILLWHNRKPSCGDVSYLYASILLANKHWILVVKVFSLSQSVWTRYYISLMDAAHNLMFVISYYIYFKLLMISFAI